MIRITSFLTHIYGKKAAHYIQQELNHYHKTLSKKYFSKKELDWYKVSNLYEIYPDAITGDKATPLRNLENFLPHIYQTGFHAVHILPFLDSPMSDKGFDVRDYYKVREDLGTMHDLDELKHTADKLQLHLFMDLVFNHVSMTHEWFARAQQGEEKYRNYFIHTKEKPDFLKKFHKNAAVWAEYIVKGKKVLVNIAFPEFAGPIPHWTQGSDGYWYYHTYKPDQIDIDWRNPDVFIECAKILLYWADKGYNFRLDAIPFVGKSAYKQINTRTHFTNHILAALNHIAKQANPQCVFILETYEHIDTVLHYLGKKNLQQAEMLYGFHLCTAIWVSLVEQNNQRTWKTLNQIKKIPTFAQWVNFLRNHDELSLAYLDTKALHSVKKILLARGKPFREGYGIAGRTFSLLGENEKQFLMAYFLLFSLPGGTMMPYGDEFAKKNIPESELLEKDRKDTRNINRGVLSKEFLHAHIDDLTWIELSRMLQVRHTIRPYFNVWPKKIEGGREIFAARYSIEDSHVYVLINLSEKSVELSFPTRNCKEILHVNTISLTEEKITLGPFGGIWLQE